MFTSTTQEQAGTQLGLWYTTMIVSLLATVCISVVMIQDIGASSTFTWHPILMTISFLVCMTQGLHSYYLGFGTTTTSNDDTSSSFLSLSLSSREYHGILMMSAFVTAMGGYGAIFLAHSHGKGHTAGGDPVVKQLHTWFGYLILIGLVVQSMMGMMKYTLLKTKKEKFASWHGVAGPILWFLGCMNISSGVYFWSSTSYTGTIQTLIALSIITTVAITILFKTNNTTNNDSSK
mmetsp:Transcript_15659/g.17602  ORF Transcript_15659/g.17602 Transcript_15659/m.17602 type:complete len:234 (-) Transcript_15659:42-743(-)